MKESDVRLECMAGKGQLAPGCALEAQVGGGVHYGLAGRCGHQLTGKEERDTEGKEVFRPGISEMPAPAACCLFTLI
jgi:hypothetical protein